MWQLVSAWWCLGIWVKRSQVDLGRGRQTLTALLSWLVLVCPCLILSLSWTLRMRRCPHRFTMLKRIRRLRVCLWVLDIVYASSPIRDSPRWCWCLRWWATCRCRSSPLRSRWSTHACLVSLRVYILRNRRIVLIDTRRLATLQQLQPCFDMDVIGIEFCGAPIGIKGVVRLVVARFILWTRCQFCSIPEPED